MTVGELVSTVGVMVAVVTGAALWYEGGGDRAGAASAGVVMEALYEGAEQFVREHGAALEDCLDNVADPATGNGPVHGDSALLGGGPGRGPGVRGGGGLHGGVLRGEWRLLRAGPVVGDPVDRGVGPAARGVDGTGFPAGYDGGADGGGE